MKKLAVILLSSTLLSYHAIADDVVMGKYKGGEVKESDIATHFKAAFDSQPTLKGKKPSELEPAVQEQLVRAYINNKLLDQEVNEKSITSDKAFQEKEAAAVRQMAQQELLERQVKAAITDQVVDAEYEKLKKELNGKEEVKASHILVDTEEKAKEAQKALNVKGATFASVAKKFSKDDGTKANGGSLGWFGSGQLVPEFEKKAFSMKPGEVSEPVKTQFGWHIIKVEDKRPMKVPTKDEAEQTIRNKLSRDAVEKYINDLNAKAETKITVKAPEAQDAKPEEKK